MRVAATVAVLLLILHSLVNAQVPLTYKVEARTKQVYEISPFSEIAAPGYDQEFDTTVVLTIENGPLDVQGHVSRTIRIDQLRQTYNHESPGLPKATLSFDSSLNLAQTDSPFLENLLQMNKVLVGAEYQLEVDESNRILSVRGADAISKRAEAANDRRLQEAIKRRLQLYAKDDAVLKGYEAVLGRFAPRKVKRGETWEQESYVNLYFVGPLIRVQRRYEYCRSEVRGGRMLEKITWVETKPVDEVEMQVLQSKGTLYFDPQFGLETGSNHALHIRYGIDEQKWSERRIDTAVRLKP